MVRWWDLLWVFLQIYKNIFNKVSPSGIFIITAAPRSLTSAKSVDSVGGPTHPNHLCRSVKSVGEYQYSHGIHGTHRTFLPRRAISTNKQYKAYVNTSTQQHYNWYVNTTTSFFLWQKKRTTRITRTGLSKNNVTLIVLNHAKTAIGPKKIIT